MASAMYPGETHAPPPPYSVQDGQKMGVPYQQQGPVPTHASNFAQPPPTIPVYAQMVNPSFVGRNPMAIQCPRCHQQIVTVVQYENGGGTWLISLLICLFGGVFGCCLIPFCVPGCQDAVHTCPACHGLVGRRNIL